MHNKDYRCVKVEYIIDIKYTLRKVLNVDISELFYQKSNDSEINGFVKIKGNIYEIKTFEDLRNLIKLESDTDN